MAAPIIDEFQPAIDHSEFSCSSYFMAGHEARVMKDPYLLKIGSIKVALRIHDKHGQFQIGLYAMLINANSIARVESISGGIVNQAVGSEAKPIVFTVRRTGDVLRRLILIFGKELRRRVGFLERRTNFDDSARKSMLSEKANCYRQENRAKVCHLATYCRRQRFIPATNRLPVEGLSPRL